LFIVRTKRKEGNFMSNSTKIGSTNLNLVNAGGVQIADVENKEKVQLESRPNSILEPEVSDVFATKLSDRANTTEASLRESLTKKADSLSPEQKERFWQCVDKVIQRSLSHVPELCDEMIELGNAGFGLSRLLGLSLEQMKSIVKYGTQMLKCGYKTDFAVDVCNSMVELYQYKDKANRSIEDILLSATGVDIVDSYESSADFARKVDDFLGEYMPNHGGSRKLLWKCHTGQGQSSYSEEGLMFQGFCLSTRANCESENYFFGPSSYKDFSGCEHELPNTSKKLIKYFEEIFNKEDPYRELNYGANYKEIFTKEVYVKTMTIYRALIAIALNRMDNLGLNLDKEKNMMTVFRSMSDYHNGHLAGIARPTSLRSGCYDPKYIEGKEYSIVKMNIPFSDVESAFFLSVGMRFDENEITCNTINAEVIEVKDVVKDAA
ncbi:MAG: hypothetical protein K2L13_01560, partial [Opitutales bacterium]|nr:hypothetical protein [Opitutales bacterium]